MSVEFPLMSTSVSSLYHLMLEGGASRVLQTSVMEVLLELLQLIPLMDGRPAWVDSVKSVLIALYTHHRNLGHKLLCCY